MSQPTPPPITDEVIAYIQWKIDRSRAESPQTFAAVCSAAMAEQEMREMLTLRERQPKPEVIECSLRVYDFTINGHDQMDWGERVPPGQYRIRLKKI